MLKILGMIIVVLLALWTILYLWEWVAEKRRERCKKCGSWKIDKQTKRELDPEKDNCPVCATTTIFTCKRCGEQREEGYVWDPDDPQSPEDATFASYNRVEIEELEQNWYKPVA